MNALASKRFYDRIVGDFNPMLDKHIPADSRAPLDHHFIIQHDRPAAQPCLTANQDVMLDDAVAFNHGILRNLRAVAHRRDGIVVETGYHAGVAVDFRAVAHPDVVEFVTLQDRVVEDFGPVFNEGSKAISVGLDAEYRNTYTASLSYTDFFGGDYNPIVDRDFLAFSVGVNF